MDGDIVQIDTISLGPFILQKGKQYLFQTIWTAPRKPGSAYMLLGADSEIVFVRRLVDEHLTEDVELQIRDILNIEGPV